VSPVSHSHASIEHQGAAALALHEHVAAGAHDHGGESGVTLSLSSGLTVVLATVLAYASGFGLTIWPLLRRGMRLWPALTTVFVGEGCWAAT